MVDDLSVEVTWKTIANLSIRVHPPDGRVRVSAPHRVTERHVRAAVRERRAWIDRHRERMRTTAPSHDADLVTGDVIPLWGVPHRLVVREARQRPSVTVSADTIVLEAAADSDTAERRALLHRGYADQVRDALPALLERWEPRMDVTVPRTTIRHMTSRWGSCNVRTRRITLNSELATRDPGCLEYVLVHEMTHYFEAGHGRRFQTFMDRFLPDWRTRRAILNGTPIPRRPT